MPQSRKRKGHRERLEKRKAKITSRRNEFVNLLRKERDKMIEERAPKVLNPSGVQSMIQHHQQRTK